MSKIKYLNENELQIIHNKQELDNNLVFIDVRTPEEHQSCHIAGSVNIPLAQISQVSAETFKHKTVVFYCRSGVRTTHYEHLLEELNTKDAMCIKGGILEWISKGLPVSTRVDKP